MERFPIRSFVSSPRCFSRQVAPTTLAMLLAVLGGLWGASGGMAQNDGTSQVLRGAQVTPRTVPEVFLGDVRTLPRQPVRRAATVVREVPRRLTSRPSPPVAPAVPAPRSELDPLLDLSTSPTAETTARAFIEPQLNFDGAGFSGAVPADPVGDIGAAHYIQMINDANGTSVTIYHKRDGGVAAGPFLLSSLGKGRCSVGHGDPIVLYDPLAQRWLLSEFSAQANLLCVYLSRTSDPVSGGWLFYAFDTPEFPDYPKYAVWPTAYFVTTNEFQPTLYALERQRMLRGEAATLQRFTVPPLAGFAFQALTPADFDGSLPPPDSAPGYFLRHRDDEAHNQQPRSDRDFLELWELHVDFSDAANSTLTGPVRLTMREFDSDLCGLFSFECFPQPSAGPPLDPLREVVMWRVQYRNFGTYESLVGNFVTDVDGNDHGGIRWFELRKRPAENWRVFQEGTHAPDTTNRWMGSMATDRAGNMALGYSVASPTIFAGLRYTGRLRNDPPGTMSQGETSLVEGRGVQFSATRWGDYSAMSVDPQNDCTFWFTSAYINESGDWQTRIGRFAFDECFATRFVLSGTNLRQDICAPGRLAPITVEVGQVRRFRTPVALSFAEMPAGISGTLTPAEVQPPGQSTVAIRLRGSVAEGTYQITVQGVMDDAAVQQLPIEVNVATAIPLEAALLLPPDGATQQAVRPLLEWSTAAGQGDFTIEIDDDPAFRSLDYHATVSATSHLVRTSLARDTQYFWRIRSRNACGTGPTSAVFRFTTANEWCQTPRAALPDHDHGGIQSTITPRRQGMVRNLLVPLRLTHTYVGDLSATLRHEPSGITVPLMDQPGVPATSFGCSEDNIDAFFDDAASRPVEDVCSSRPRAIAGSVQPQQPLSAFAGVDGNGPWTLTVADLAAEDTGTLNRWCVRFSPASPAGIAGAVTGIQPRVVECRNQTTEQTVRVPEPQVAWDCRAAGLESRPGDSIRVRVRGTADSTSWEGAVGGMTTTTAVCHNVTTGQSRLLALQGATSWDCLEAGLAVTTGDTVTTTIQGIITE